MNIIDKTGWPSPDDLEERNRKGETWTMIGKMLGVSRNAVQDYVKNRAGENVESAEHAIIKSDAAFMKRMLRAIDNGREIVRVGVKVDLSPLRVRPIGVTPRFSGCGSPAANCADAG